MGYSARRGFTNGKISGAARQAELQQKIAAMQEKMTEAQDAVEAQEFTASVGGGVVEAKVNGKKEVLSGPAMELYNELSKEFMVDYDETGSIGKAYGYQLAVKHHYPEGDMDQVDRVLYDLKHNPASRGS